MQIGSRQAGRFARFCEILGGQKSLGGVSSVVYQANRCRDCDMTGGLLRLCAHGWCLLKSVVAVRGIGCIRDGWDLVRVFVLGLSVVREGSEATAL